MKRLNLKEKARKLGLRDWTPCRMCDCCGRLIVLLKIPESEQRPDRPKRKTCYARGWDGNPYFLKENPFSLGNATPHSRKRYARYMADKEPPKSGGAPVDPEFILE